MSSPHITIGTRGSQLALAQTDWVATSLRTAHPDAVVDVKRIVTRGDRQQKSPLPEIGGKGLFTAELETALLEGTIDLAVHSAKDLPTTFPDGLALAVMPAREDPRDVLVSRDGRHLTDLPDGAVLGTSSLRRQAQLRMHRPDLAFTVLRGNVDTRIRKVLVDGQCDATVLAMAGLLRIGLQDHVTEVLDPDRMLPAAGQGALALQTRAEDDRVRALLAALQHEATYRAVLCERYVIRQLQGGCQAPIGVSAQIDGDRLACRAVVVSLDGQRHARAQRTGTADEIESVGQQVVDQLRDAGADEILAACRR